MTLRHTTVRAYAKSVVVGGRALYPLNSPLTLADQLRAVIGKLEENAYAQGRRDAKAEIRKVMNDG